MIAYIFIYFFFIIFFCFSFRFPVLCVELFICAFHSIPYLMPPYAGLFVFLRLYLFIRVLRDRSDVYKWRRNILKSGVNHIKHYICLKVIYGLVCYCMCIYVFFFFFSF
jgi:hypothetical protein